MNKKWLFILLILLFPMMVHATSYTHAEAVQRMEDFHKNYYDSKKYILQRNALSPRNGEAEADRYRHKSCNSGH